MYAKVVIDLKNEMVDATYTYLIPSEYEKLDLIGVRVLVEFGIQKILGYILEVSDKCDFAGKIKPILEILDFKKEINEEQIALAKNISETTICTLTQSLQIMVPSFLRSKFRKYLIVNDYDNMDANLAILLGGKNKVLITKDILEKYNLVKKELEKGTIEIAYDTFTYGKLKKIREYYPNPEFDTSKIKSKKRKLVFEYLDRNPLSSISQITEEVNVSDLIIKAMEKDQIIKYRITEKQRNYDLHPPKVIDYKMNLIQEQLYQKYIEGSKKQFLLYTNDELFKYNFLIKTIRKTIKEDKKVFIIAPTILTYINALKYLTPALTDLRVLNFSLKMSNYEFYENYVTLKADNYDIVITTKVGMFLPVNNVGLMIMLDCDNYNYVSEQTPKYDGVQVMEFRSNYHNANIIYTTNTPNLGMYHDAVYGKITFLKYIISLGSEITLINEKASTLKNEFDCGVSVDVINGVKDALSHKKKSLLLINQKGFSKNIVCRKCGESLICPKCHIPYTYFKDKNILKCNYCDSKVPYVNSCTNCGSNDLVELGVGIEQVRQKIAMQFPKANILQIDSDVFINQKSYEELLMAIEEEDYDIIIGTSISLSCAAYSDIEFVALLDCDGILNFSDYRASEECFKLIAKLSSFKNAKIYVQGLNLNHYAISCAIKNDYAKFYDLEMKNRKMMNYYPVKETSRIIITGEYKDMYYYANYFKKVFKSLFKDNGDVLGPSYNYRYKGVQLIVKYSDFDLLRKIIIEVNKKFEKAKILVNYERYPRTFS